MAERIGIIGVSPEGSSICYRRVGRMVSDLDAGVERPTVILHNSPFSRYVELIRADEWEAVAGLLLESAEALHAAGATFCILPDNVTHHVLPIVASKSPVPILNMVEATAAFISAEGFNEVGLIGTKFVTFGSTYQTVLGMRGVKLRVPSEPEADMIDGVLFGEAVYGGVSAASADLVHGVVLGLQSRGCEALILGASEASLMLRGSAEVLPVIDPVELLSKLAIVRCLDGGDREDGGGG